MTDPEDKGFTVKDRRFSQQPEEEKDRLREESRQQAAREAYETESNKTADAGAPKTEGPLPEITMASFIMSLGTSVFFHLGELPHPETGAVREKSSPG